MFGRTWSQNKQDMGDKKHRGLFRLLRPSHTVTSEPFLPIAWHCEMDDLGCDSLYPIISYQVFMGISHVQIQRIP